MIASSLGDSLCKCDQKDMRSITYGREFECRNAQVESMQSSGHAR